MDGYASHKRMVKGISSRKKKQEPLGGESTLDHMLLLRLCLSWKNDHSQHDHVL